MSKKMQVRRALAPQLFSSIGHILTERVRGAGSMGTEMTLGAELPATTGGASSRPQRRGSGGRGSGDRRKSSKKDDLRSKNREAQRRFREKQK